MPGMGVNASPIRYPARKLQGRPIEGGFEAVENRIGFLDRRLTQPPLHRLGVWHDCFYIRQIIRITIKRNPINTIPSSATLSTGLRGTGAIRAIKFTPVASSR